MATPTILVEEQRGKGKRIRYPSTKLRDFFTNTIQKVSPSSSPPPCTSSQTSGIFYPIAHFVNCDRFSIGHQNFLATITTTSEPQSFKAAMRDPGWQEAMQKEIQALEKTIVLGVTDLPPGKKALGSQWVYKIKYNSDSSVKHLNARLVVFGNHQVEGIDYSDTVAPVVKMTTVRAFLAVVVAKN